LRSQDVLEEFGGQQRELRAGLLGRHFLVAFPGFHQAQIRAGRARGHLGGGEPWFFNSWAKLILSRNALAAISFRIWPWR